MIIAVSLDADRAINVIELAALTPTDVHAVIGGHVLATRPLPPSVLAGLKQGHSAVALHTLPPGAPLVVDPALTLAELSPALIVAHDGATVLSMTPPHIAAVAAYLVAAEGFANPT